MLPSVQPSGEPAPALLPEFIPPMLAESGQPFDSDEYSFEIKWDGTRAVAYIDRPGGYRILNRRRVDVTSRYPELEFLGSLPPGTVLDGEMVMLKDGKPDFDALQGREHSRNAMHIGFAAARSPATYVVFDLIFAGFQPATEHPLIERREALRHLIETVRSPRLVFSDGIVGAGKAYFEAVIQQGLEGVVAKRLDSRYLPGKRTDCWIKIKRQQTCVCVVIGFVPEGKDDIGSLLIAMEDGGKIAYVGRVGSGMSAEQRRQIRLMLDALLQPGPVIECRHKGAVWVRPAVYCRVRYMERTSGGQLRAPVFVEICHVGH